jgi:hypothetical protein
MLLGLPAGADQGDEILDQLRRTPVSTLADAVDEVDGQTGLHGERHTIRLPAHGTHAIISISILV